MVLRVLWLESNAREKVEDWGMWEKICYLVSFWILVSSFQKDSSIFLICRDWLESYVSLLLLVVAYWPTCSPFSLSIFLFSFYLCSFLLFSIIKYMRNLRYT